MTADGLIERADTVLFVAAGFIQLASNKFMSGQ